MEETAALKLAVVLIGFCMLIHHYQAVQYAVGDATGWTLGSLDTLLFVYTAGDHTVLQVTKADHDSCTTTSPLKSYMGGRTVVPLSKAAWC